MNEEKIMAAIDIGTTKVCAVIGRMNEFNKLEILGMGNCVSEGVTRGLITNIEKTTEAIRKAVNEAQDQAGMEVHAANVGIAGQYIKSYNVTGRHHKPYADDITLQDVNQLTEEMYKYNIPNGSQIIHVLPQDYTIDDEYQRDPVGTFGKNISANFHIIAAQSTAVSNIYRSMKNARIAVQNIILEPLASCLAILSPEEKETGVALIDIGGGTTDIAIFHDGLIRHSAVIPLGGNIITSDIKHGCMVVLSQAELMKIKFGCAMASLAKSNEVISIQGIKQRPPKEISTKSLAYIIEARMEEIIDIINAEIEYSGYANKLGAGIVLTGGGSLLHGIDALFQLRTSHHVKIGMPTEFLGKSRFDNIKKPTYATAIGLVLAGFRSIDDRANERNNISWSLNHEDSLSDVVTYKTDKKPAASIGGWAKTSQLFEKMRHLLTDDIADDDRS
jgi:cell division protein FtsA